MSEKPQLVLAISLLSRNLGMNFEPGDTRLTQSLGYSRRKCSRVVSHAYPTYWRTETHKTGKEVVSWTPKVRDVAVISHEPSAVWTVNKIYMSHRYALSPPARCYSIVGMSLIVESSALVSVILIAMKIC